MPRHVNRRELVNELAEVIFDNPPRAREIVRELREQEEQPTFIPDEQAAVFHTPAPAEPELREVPIPVDPLYERQAPLRLSQPDVILIGAGGVGCWIALSLVLGGIKYLTIFDGDTLSTHNLNRFPLPIASVGSLKSEALANWLRTLRPDAEIIARGQFDSNIHDPRADWLICATDSLKSRRECYKYAQMIGMRYLEVGADGERWTLSPSPPEFSTEAESEPGYATVPVHVGPCMMAGAAAAYYVLHDEQPIGTHSMNWDSGQLVGSWMSEVRTWDQDAAEADLVETEVEDEREAEHGQEEP